MAPDDLDNVDKGILYLLQQNARSNTTSEVAEKVGVSSSTVSNRISRLEQQDIITGYSPTVDYQKAGLSHHFLAIATVPFEKQEDFADDIMDVTGVVGVRELLTHQQNVAIEIVGFTREDIDACLPGLSALGVTVQRMEVMKRERRKPFNHFGQQYTTEGSG